jgi:CheY-like chemotaxis protein
VQVSVADQGCGIPPEILPRIFDPYFSTKKRDARKGMGLGLTICDSVIKKHGGAICVESKPGAGATFRFYLPASDKPVAGKRREGAIAAPGIPPGPAKILVMDDKDCMRAAISAVLEARGFMVAEARHGREAIDLYVDAKTQGAPFDVVILDLTVRGGMGGVDTVNALRKITPTVKAIAMSGCSGDPVMADYKRHGFKGAIVKTFDVEQLIDAISSVLAKRQPAVNRG